MPTYQGTKIVNNLYKYNSKTGFPTGEVKPNVVGDPDYIAPDPDSPYCPIIETEWVGTDPFCEVKTIFENILQSQTFTKDNCLMNYHGTDAIYSVLAGTYLSSLSQLAADQKALDDIALNGQNFANANGDCLINDPNEFNYLDQTNLPINYLTESNTQVITGPYSSYEISISGGEYQINGGSWTSSIGTVNNGDSVKLRKTSSSSYETVVSAVITIGSLSYSWNLTTAADITPDPYYFVDKVDANINELYYSNVITISGISSTAAISITGGEYNIDGSGWTNSPGTVLNGYTVQVRGLSSSSYSTSVDVVLTVGTYSDTYSILTVAASDVTPDPFFFTDIINNEVNTLYTSNSITISGLTTAASVSIVDGEYRINGTGSWLTTSSTVFNSDTIEVRRLSSQYYSTTVSTTLTVGTYSDTYSIGTRAANNVTVNFSMSFGLDPSTNHWMSIERTREGITTVMGLISSNNSGTFPAGDFKEGDTLNVYQGSYDSFMWAPTSKVNLSITVDSVLYYSADTTSQGTSQASAPYIIAPGVLNIDINSVGSSTAIGYLTKTLLTENSLAAGDFIINVSDNGESGLGLLNLETNAGSSAFSFNVKNSVDLLTVSIQNTTISDMNYIIEGEGGYIKSGVISAALTISYSDVTKGGLTITIGEQVGNEFVSQAFQKNDCTTGESGTYVTYSVAANTYFASTLAAANTLAINDISTNGQTFANTNGTCLVNTINAIISIDMYNDDNLDVCGYIDTPGVAESGSIVARDGQNFFLSTDPAESAYMLASDNIVQPTLKRRFLFNIGKLIAQYPNDVAIPEFIFKIRGRSSTAGLKSGMWQREYPDVAMIMTGGPSTYIPTTSPSGGPPADSWTANVSGGGDGSVGIGIGDVILTFTYNRASNTITLVTA